MFDTVDSPYAYAGNFGNSFLEMNADNMMGASQSAGLLSSNFNNVMSSMSANINQNAQQGIVPFFNTANYSVQAAQAKKLGVPTFGGLTLAQISSQMSVGGPMSALPYLGANLLPKLIFPLAGLWSIFGGIKAIAAIKKEEMQNSPAQFDSKQLNYDRTRQEIYEAANEWKNLGPFNQLAD